MSCGAPDRVVRTKCLGKCMELVADADTHLDNVIELQMDSENDLLDPDNPNYLGASCQDSTELALQDVIDTVDEVHSVLCTELQKRQQEYSRADYETKAYLDFRQLQSKYFEWMDKGNSLLEEATLAQEQAVTLTRRLEAWHNRPLRRSRRKGGDSDLLLLVENAAEALRVALNVLLRYKQHLVGLRSTLLFGRWRESRERTARDESVKHEA